MRTRAVWFAALFLAAAGSAVSLKAHDNWISQGHFLNGQGEGCCGEDDCAELKDHEVSEIAGGWYVAFAASNEVGRQSAVDENVPVSEALKSPDGRYWRCRRADGTRRCFFAPPPST